MSWRDSWVCVSARHHNSQLIELLYHCRVNLIAPNEDVLTAGYHL